MLSDTLACSYRHYKSDTGYVLTWLALTANNYGYVIKSDSSEKPARTAGRLKGKARKEAKRVEEEKEAKEAAECVVGVADLTPMSKHIADHMTRHNKLERNKTKLAVPRSIIASLTGAIRLRVEFGAMLEEHGYEVDIQTKVEHEHFVRVLTQVLEVLRPHEASGEAPKNDTPLTERDGTSETANRFKALQVEEPSLDFLDAPDVELPQPDQPTSPKVRLRAEPQTKVDALIVLWALLGELTAMRTYVADLWKRDFRRCERTLLSYAFKHGSCCDADSPPPATTLATKALVSNAAIGIASNMMEEASTLLDQHGGYHALLEELYEVAQLEAPGRDQASPPGPAQDDDVLPPLDRPMVRDTYFLASSMLTFARRHSSGREAFACFYNLGPEEPSRVPLRDEYLDYFKISQLLYLEANAEPGYRSFDGLPPGWPALDEIMLALLNMKETDKYPFAVLFGVQLLFDISDVLPEDKTIPHCTMIRELYSLHDELHRDLVYMRSRPPSRQVEGIIEDLEQLQYQVGRMRSSPSTALFDVRRVPADVASYLDHDFTPGRLLVECSPIICGLILATFRGLYHGLGRQYYADNYTIMSALHLHNALRREGLARQSWPDQPMIWWALHDTDLFAAGDQPDSKQNYFSRFLFEMGFSLEAARCHLRNDTPLSGRRRKHKESVIPVTSWISSFSRNMVRQGPWTPEEKELVLFKSQWASRPREQLSTAERSTLKRPNTMEVEQKRWMLAGARRHWKRSSVPPWVLMRHLTEALTSEEVEFSAPFFAMHRAASEALQVVVDACVEDCHPAFSASQKSERGAKVVYEILDAFYRLSHSKGSQNSREKAERLLRSASGALDEFSESAEARRVSDHMQKWLGLSLGTDWLDGVARHTLVRKHPQRNDAGLEWWNPKMFHMPPGQQVWNWWVTPQKKMPQEETPREETPQEETLQEETLGEETSKEEAIQEEALQEETPKEEALQEEALQEETPQEQTLQEETPK